MGVVQAGAQGDDAATVYASRADRATTAGGLAGEEEHYPADLSGLGGGRKGSVSSVAGKDAVLKCKLCFDFYETVDIWLFF